MKENDNFEADSGSNAGTGNIIDDLKIVIDTAKAARVERKKEREARWKKFENGVKEKVEKIKTDIEETLIKLPDLGELIESLKEDIKNGLPKYGGDKATTTSAVSMTTTAPTPTKTATEMTTSTTVVDCSTMSHQSTQMAVASSYAAQPSAPSSSATPSAVKISSATVAPGPTSTTTVTPAVSQTPSYGAPATPSQGPSYGVPNYGQKRRRWLW